MPFSLLCNKQQPVPSTLCPCRHALLGLAEALPVAVAAAALHVPAVGGAPSTPPPPPSSSSSSSHQQQQPWSISGGVGRGRGSGNVATSAPQTAEDDVAAVRMRLERAAWTAVNEALGGLESTVSQLRSAAAAALDAEATTADKTAASFVETAGNHGAATTATSSNIITTATTTTTTDVTAVVAAAASEAAAWNAFAARRQKHALCLVGSGGGC